MELAEDLGAEVLTLESGDVAGALAQLARERHITQIVIGKSGNRSRMRDIFGQSTTRRLLDLVTQDVHLVSPTPKGQAGARGGEE
jgi:two-component system sensor histidine kinase KdpD